MDSYLRAMVTLTRPLGVRIARRLGLVPAADHRRELGRLRDHYRTARAGDLEHREELEQRLAELELLLAGAMNRADNAAAREHPAEERDPRRGDGDRA